MDAWPLKPNNIHESGRNTDTSILIEIKIILIGLLAPKLLPKWDKSTDLKKRQKNIYNTKNRFFKSSVKLREFP